RSTPLRHRRSRFGRRRSGRSRSAVAPGEDAPGAAAAQTLPAKTLRAQPQRPAQRSRSPRGPTRPVAFVSAFRMIELCDRRYALPARKTVVFCIDGCAPEYLDQALEDGLMPRLAGSLAAGGLYVRGRGQIPSFTNPNNLSIVTGQP